ncbi:MAG: thiolase domain-containing protein, partial [Caldisphaera sp.]|nr:thiolase domain-containing protein [Caldisphaera sp.]
MSRVAIVGAGWYGFKPQTIDISFQDMMFESSSRAYSNLDPRKDIDAFVDCQEDMWEGIAIADE